MGYDITLPMVIDVVEVCSVIAACGVVLAYAVQGCFWIVDKLKGG